MFVVSGICKKVSTKSKAKLQAAIFVGPEIQKLINDKFFEENFNSF